MLIATAVLYWGALRKGRGTKTETTRPDMVILLRDGEVVDFTPDAPDMLDQPDLCGLLWDDLRGEFIRRFPETPDDLPQGTMKLIAQDDPDTILSISSTGPHTRLSIQSKPINAGQMHRLARDRGQLETFRYISQNNPNPVWITNSAEVVTWGNSAYFELCDQVGEPGDESCPFDLAPATTNTARTSRLSLPINDNTRRWFEVLSRPIPEGWVHFATCIDGLVEAEMAQRNFVQTLTKTFAHLPIGLAVFNRDRRLVLFNPALVDLTYLSVEFLSSKPNLFSFFDQMRDNRMMPEPKNYTTWREKIYDVISAAREDRYNETWNLPSGLTYKITGRPHPDGAVAFLIEDISAEISLTRRFRSELELTQSVFDCFEDAVCVFSRLGVLTFANAAYRDLWKADPDGAFAEVTIVDTTRDWQNACEPAPIWPELREYVLSLQDRSPWEVDLRMTNGQQLRCVIAPVAAGATMVRFTKVSRFSPQVVRMRNDSIAATE
ncbi:PAS fold [Tropicibacter naphthalenivorans]|uniref:Sensor protein DivL n=2 Tax=Tropicibacter naphthalenivorans TaxID=441103 RepID=A0A0N7M056_9RHOB|nr:Sensor protein DivL [Tropicibacter naphthalenivorans]SMC73349.1 PAS fold [Tropicibacter naphthalenivorans]